MIEAKRMDRLISLSHSHKESCDIYTQFDWPEALAVDRLWCDEDLLTTYDTEIHAQLTDEQKYHLSKWEAINFCSLNVHGIKTVLEFVSRIIYSRRYEPISEYLHLFLSEENDHMWFFAKFCLMYGGKLYPAFAFPVGKPNNPVENDLYMFASTLIFEEFVDFYNHRVGKNKEVHPVIQAINHHHHIDESRHVSFGREIVKSLFDELCEQNEDPEQRERISKTVKGLIDHFTGLMYNARAYKDADIALGLGFKTAAALRNHLRNDQQRIPHHHRWFNRTESYFERIGLFS